MLLRTSNRQTKCWTDFDLQSVTQSYKEPKIEDFYNLSPNMKKYQKIRSVGMGVGTGLLVSRLI